MATNKNVDETVAEIQAPEPKVQKKVYKGDDTIPCRSVTRGLLVHIGKKTGEIYRWADYGDVTEVEYQDLMALRATRAKFLYGPMFIIEDDELLEDERWKGVKEVYAKAIKYEDLNRLLQANSSEFTAILKDMPKAMRKAVSTEIATRLEEGTFDSLQKVKIVDEICGTDLKLLL